jgi:hypothetical protein
VGKLERIEPPYRFAALAGACVFALYVLTLSPTTAFWDTSEYIASAHIMGIAHPPGNPLFVLLGRAWDLLLTPTGLSVAVRINLFSALMSALAHGCWFLVVHRILGTWSDSARFRLIGAAAAVLCSATAFTVWNQSNVNEKVYTVSLFTIALLSWIAFRWRDRALGERNDNLLVFTAFVLALSVGNHLMAVLAGPALLVFIVLVRPRTLLDWRLYPLAVVAVALGLSVNLFLPMRAKFNPLVNEADPRCESVPSALVSILTVGRAGCPALSDALQRRQYLKPSMFNDPVYEPYQHLPRSPALVAAQAVNYLQYFDWQWARSVRGNNGWFGGARPLLTLLFIAIGCYGAMANYKRDKASFAYMAVLLLTLSAGLVFYLNFKYGYSSPWADQLRTNTEVRERDYFFIVSFSLWGLWTGLGLVALWQRFNTPAFLAIAFVPLFANWTWASRAGDYVARDWSYNLLMSVEPYGVLITNGDNDTFPLWYLQEVEGVRRDVTVIVGSYLNTDWYARQLRDLTTPCRSGTNANEDSTRIICQRAFTPPAAATDLYATSEQRGDAAGVAADAGAPGKRLPRHSILELSDARIGELARTAFISPASTVTAGNVVTEIAAGTEIQPADLFLAQIIKSSIDDRPIYFATTSFAFSTLNLKDYLVQRGVAYKLMNGKVAADPARGIFELQVPNGVPNLIDVAVTDRLLTSVFVHHPGFPEDWKHWTDVATQNTPLFYANPLHAAAFYHGIQGDTLGMQRLETKARAFERLANVRAVEAGARTPRSR